MRRLLKTILLLGLSATMLVSCANYKNRKAIQIDSTWRYSLGDNLKWAQPSFDDSSWKTLNSTTVDMGTYHYVWFRTKAKVSSSLDANDLWFEFPRNNSSSEVYADGVLIGIKGSFPPAENVRGQEIKVVLVPSSCVKNGTVDIAVRMYVPSNQILGVKFALTNRTNADFENYIHNLFNQRLFIILTFLCLFIMVYCVAIYSSNPKDVTYLYFAIGLLFVIIYFYDIGAENLLLDFNLQRALCRACLPGSMCFIMLFLNRFFNRKYHKQILIGTIVFLVIDVVLYVLLRNQNALVELLFNVMLVPVLITIVYGFVTSIQGVKKHEPYSVNILIGFSAASFLAVHDVAYSVMGKIPFMWTQALAFFAVDLAVFITLCMRSALIQKQVVILAEKSEAQRTKLSQVFESAKQMVERTSTIAEKLNDSVETVTLAAHDSNEKVAIINQAIAEQTSISSDTSSTINQLASFLQAMAKEFDDASENIKDTAEGTKNVMEKMTSVGEGIASAAEFSHALTQITKSGTQDMEKLIVVMNSIQDSSKEILNVATTLDNFAQQTDLLSMNASIEAAHAGDAGKGFAVIAHEVKNLAAQSSAWAIKISEIIKTIINSIGEGVSLTTKVNNTLVKIRDEADLSAQKVNAASQDMHIQQESGKEIINSTAHVIKSASQMKTGIAEQEAFSQKTLVNMDSLMKASSKVSDASKDISSVSATLTQQVESLRSIAEQTHAAAIELKQLMEIK